MSQDNDKNDAEKPLPGPGVSKWLTQTIGQSTNRPQHNKTGVKLDLPPGLAGTYAPEKKIDLFLPENVIRATGATLQKIEIRGLPKGVRLSKGLDTQKGYWQIDPDLLSDIRISVPEYTLLPFSIMLKGIFVGETPDQVWSEVTSYEVADPIAPTTTPEVNPQMPPDMETDTPTSMVVIDLDVSVGTEDPEVLQGIIVQFSGLPDGVTLSAGQVDHKGIWTVPAAILPDLSVIMPVGTEDFELDVMMQVAGSAPQTASIQVVNEFQETAPETAFMIRLAPSVGNSAIRFSVYTDGTASYDRIITWPEGKAGSLDVWVPYPATALPFEIVMRHAPLDDAKSAAPKFMGIDIDGDFIRPDSPAIAVNGTLDDVGMAWQGDLVIDVRRALKSILTDAGEAFEKPTVTDKPVQLPDTETPEAEASSLDILLDDESDPESEAVFEPDHAPDLSDQLLTPSSTENVQAPKSGVLVMDASFDDLQDQAFTDELRRLRDFIRTRPTGNDGEVYARLGIDVTKWHDMVVVGPVGATVELDPLLPTLAPTGGIDNTRFLSRLRVDNESGITSGHVTLQGLAPGTLLTHGKNNGDGTWTIPVSDLSKTALLPQMGVSKTRAIHAVWKNDTDARKSIHHSLLIGSKHKSPEFPATKMRSIKLPLEPAMFDPKASQFLSLTLGDIPPGILVSDGSNHGGGVWTLETTSGSMLTLYAAAAMKPFSMSITCVALNEENGDSTVVSRVAEIIPVLGTIALRNEQAA